MTFNVKQTTFKVFLALLVANFAATALTAQTKEFVDKYNEKFLKRDPKIGTVLPEVSVFDENGKAMKLGSTRGKYSVLIFGCLT